MSHWQFATLQITELDKLNSLKLAYGGSVLDMSQLQLMFKVLE
jgi:hypothetical protein